MKVLRENLKLMRRSIRSALGLPLLSDLIKGGVDEDLIKGGVLEALSSKRQRPPTNLRETAIQEAPMPAPMPLRDKLALNLLGEKSGFGLIESLKGLLEESVKQIHLRTRLMEALVKSYEKEVQEEKPKRKLRGIHY